MVRPTGLAVALMGFCLFLQCALSRADEAPATDQAPLAARQCVDMNGREFAWSWSNVPFASSCTGAPPREASVRETEACRAACSDRFGACSAGLLDKAKVDACFDGMESCQAACATGKN
ncbi:hypothetical protein JQ604_10500 [Bradyrhizobium jicamae]|uniref:hypothetical protein n=1 Tax=Bradyrhizobium jicamae TaxID=280332 RepID=UPI001BAA213A|nr:hypothetical protein [Bradyrhizobium jicamae]MBR0752614.1 hypothetical protein [Bradyrhizobium jicamae]